MRIIFDEDMPEGQYNGATIPEGSRNATMSRFAGKVIKKYGDGDTAYQAFLEEADKCDPPLDAAELATIWHSAQRFYARVQQQEGYVAPELYNDPSCYKPEDYSDVGQAEVLAKYFSNELRYSPPPTLSATLTTTGRNQSRVLRPWLMSLPADS